MARIKSEALYEVLSEQGLQPEFVEEETEIVLCCPLCEDDKARLYVNAETGAWTCFHCHEQGGLHRLFLAVCEMDGNSAFEAGRLVRTRHEDELMDFFDRPVKEKAPVDAVLKLPPQFVPITPDAPDIFLRYLKRRHVSPELAISRGIGYAMSGRYSYRVIVPVESDGVLYTYIARTVLKECPNCQLDISECVCQPRKFPKVLTPLSKQGARPSHTLYNLDAVRRSRSPRVIVVEGVFDALRRPAEAVALMGSSASITQVTLLAGLARGREVILALDGDEAGWKGALKLAEALVAEMVPVRVALLTEGSDPGSLSSLEFDRCLHEARAYVV